MSFSNTNEGDFMVEEKLDYKLEPLYKYKGVVLRVVDGDTVETMIDMGFKMFTKQRLRIDAIDTPETWRPKSEAEKIHGEAAKTRAIELLEGKEVIFTTSKSVGIYGRFGASITLENGQDYATLMINEGFEKKENYVVEETS